jgi:CDP-diacylglycerol--serine O-phosphatidyltransferase
MALTLKLFKNTRIHDSKFLTIIPFLFTCVNALAGFLAIICALENRPILGGYCIIIAVIMDACDGTIARALNCCSDIGFELDSLSDVVSFCVAPAVLLYKILGNSLGVIGLLVLMLYLLCGLFRLARFNCIGGHYLFFKGLPTTMAAFFLATLIINHDWLIQHSLRIVVQPKIVLVSILFIALCMISTLPFSSTKRIGLTGTSMHLLVLATSSMILISIIKGFPLLLVLSFSYILHAIVTFLQNSMRIRFLKS